MFQMLHPALAQASALSAVVRTRAPEPAPPARPAHDAADDVEIRLAWQADAPALVRLAELDSAPRAAAELPALAADGKVLVALVEGEIVAALSLTDGLAVADPLRRTRAITALLRLRAAQIARAGAAPRHRFGRLATMRLRPH